MGGKLSAKIKWSLTVLEPDVLLCIIAAANAAVLSDVWDKIKE
jgi:hypothetical protein